MTDVDALLGRYFEASTQADIDAAEAEIRQRSRGPLSRERGVRSAVLFGELDDERRSWIGHLEMRVPVPHPAGAGVTRCVPVLPVAQRPMIHVDGAMGECAADVLYRRLVRGNEVLQYATGDAATEFAETQLAPVLVTLRAGRAARAWPLWQSTEALPPRPVAPPEQRLFHDAAAIWGLRIFDDGTGLIAFSRAVVVFRLRDGKVLRTLPTGGARYVCAPTAEHAVLVAFSPTGGLRYDGIPAQCERPFTMELAKGRWVESSDDTASVWFEERMERSLLRGDGRVLPLPVDDYPIVEEPSADHRFIWVEDKHGNGGIFRVRDGAFVARIGEPRLDSFDVPQLSRDGTIQATRESFHVASGTALARTAQGRWLTLRDGVVCEDGAPLVTLAAPSQVAAFGPDAATLWVTDRKAVRRIELTRTGAVVKSTWDFAPLRLAAKAPARLKRIKL